MAKQTKDGLQLDKAEIKTEVEKAIRLCEEIKRDAPEMDIDDIQHAIEKIEIALRRVNKDLL